MATKINHLPYSKEVVLLLFVFIFLFSNCYSFRNGYRKFYSNQHVKAAKIFKRKIGHRIWDEGAVAYWEFIKLNNAHTLKELRQIDSTLCSVSKNLYNMPNSRKKEKLNKYRINLPRLDTVLLNTQTKAIESVRVSGQISGLDTLFKYFPCWQRRDSLEIFATNMVNNMISGSSEMKSSSLTENCYFFFSPASLNISYENATRIIDHHAHRIKPNNLEKFWAIEQNIWEIFRNESPRYVDMDRFRDDHPDHPYTQDPWYDAAWRDLCIDSLKIALDFHRKNPYSVFDKDICNHILCLYSQFSTDSEKLSETEVQQIEDIGTMALLERGMCSGMIGDTTYLFQILEDLSRKYHQHDVVFNLVTMAVNLYIQREQPKITMKLIERLYPYFVEPDVSSPIEYKLRMEKQVWFQQYAKIIDATEASTNKRANPIKAWNTEENDEFSAVSWGDGDEVYFVRRDSAGVNQIMCSIYDYDLSWSIPFPIEELSFSPDVVPVSISNNGLWLLLRSGGKIWQSRRPYYSWSWSIPEPLILDLPFVTWAAFTPDNNSVLIEGISDLDWLRKDIFLCKMAKNGRFGKPEKLRQPVNSDFYNDTHPIITAGGRRLYFASDKPGGMGGRDNYVISLPESLNFTSPSTSAVHLGWHSNTWGDDAGFSFISEYSGKGFFHRPDLCGHNLDIFEINMLPAPRRENSENACDPNQINHILCFAGIILDENNKPIPGDKGSFIEFITDYNLNVTKELISKNGTYFYTAPNHAKAVRLFPEIPGYYSERDTTHFPAILSEDQIIRDTFILTSFDYIRKNFKMHYGTFYNGTAEFDDKERVYPEIIRLAKIASRMGAELELSGHTDNTGIEGENYALAKNRADAVKSFLVETCGFDEKKIITKGFGSTKPKCSNDTEEGRRCNRRIEIVFKMPELPQEKELLNKSAASNGPSSTSKD